MRSDLLLKLADLLESEAENKEGVNFDLHYWAAPEEGMHFKNKEVAIPMSCQTRACAMGLAAISGAFKDEGLTYELEYSRSANGFIMHPVYNGHRGFDAAAELFGIEDEDAIRLFSPDLYTVTTGADAEREVASRIRQLVSDHQSSPGVTFLHTHKASEADCHHHEPLHRNKAS
jgi:hypothetical protein